MRRFIKNFPCGLTAATQLKIHTHGYALRAPAMLQKLATRPTHFVRVALLLVFVRLSKSQKRACASTPFFRLFQPCIIKKTTAVFLSALILFSACYDASAAVIGPKYVSDIQIGYGEEGKKALKDAGYKVADYNFNEYAGYNDNNSDQTAVYLGYKTTFSREEGITDLAVMNMNGNYSFNDYEKLLEEQKESISAALELYSEAVEGFRENYKAGKAPAIYASKLLNLFYEDDSGNNLGDFFTAGSTTAEQLQTLFLQGNTEYLSYAEMFIAYGLHDSDDTLYDRLSGMDIDDEYQKNLYSVCRSLISAISDLQVYFDALNMADKKYKFKMTDEDLASFMEEYGEELGAEQLYNISVGYSLKKLTVNVPYAGAALPDGNDATLYSILLMEEEELYEDNYYYLLPLAAALTKGQASCMEFIGLKDILLIENYEDNDLKEIVNDALDKLPKDYTPVSVYYEVDRSMFNPDGIALTDSAAKSGNDDSGSSWTGGDAMVLKEKYSSMRECAMALGAAAGVIAVGIVFYAIALAGKSVAYATLVMQNLSFASFSSMNFVSKGLTVLSIRYGAAVTFSIVAAVAVLVLTCLASVLIFCAWNAIFGYEQIPQDKDYDYTRKPRAIVDSETDADGNTYYAYYYAAKDTDGEIGDLNGNDTKNPEWLCLYYTKDTRQGDPIAADFEFNTDGKIKNGFSGVHNFSKGAEGVRTAFNLNYGTAKSTGAHYMFVRHISEEQALNYAGSAFAGSSIWLVSAMAFALGAALSGGLVYGFQWKKKRSAVCKNDFV